jgi:hypothetical protein
MTEEDKQLIAEYMGWQPYPPACVGDVLFYVDTTYRPIRWDLNNASLCVAEMQKRGEWQDFVQITSKIHKLGFHSEVIAWLFNAENFFSAMSEWLKERGK